MMNTHRGVWRFRMVWVLVLRDVISDSEGVKSDLGGFVVLCVARRLTWLLCSEPSVWLTLAIGLCLWA